MKLLIAVITLLLLSTFLYAIDLNIEDTADNRLSEANRYLNVMPSKDMLIDLVSKMSQQIPEGKQKIFHDLMLKNLDLEKFTIIVRDSMVNHFTAEELGALANFYGSPVGKSAMVKFGDYMAEAMPKIQVLMVDAAQKTKKQIDK